MYWLRLPSSPTAARYCRDALRLQILTIFRSPRAEGSCVAEVLALFLAALLLWRPTFSGPLLVALFTAVEVGPGIADSHPSVFSLMTMHSPVGSLLDPSSAHDCEERGLSTSADFPFCQQASCPAADSYPFSWSVSCPLWIPSTDCPLGHTGPVSSTATLCSGIIRAFLLLSLCFLRL